MEKGLCKDIMMLIERCLSQYRNSAIIKEYRDSTELYGNYVIFRPSMIYLEHSADLDMYGFYFNYRKLELKTHYCNDIWNFRIRGSHGQLPKKYF